MVPRIEKLIFTETWFDLYFREKNIIVYINSYMSIRLICHRYPDGFLEIVKAADL